MTGRTKDAFRERIIKEKKKRTYDALEEIYGVNRWYLWHLINDPDFEPSPKVRAKLGIDDKKLRIVIEVDGGRNPRIIEGEQP